MTDQPGLGCNQVVELVTEYLDGWLDGDVRATFEVHLTLCPGCDVYLDQIRATIAALGRLPAGPRSIANLPAGTLPEQAQARLLKAFRSLNTR